MTYVPAEEESLISEQLLHRPASLIIIFLGRSDSIGNLIAKAGVPRVHVIHGSGTHVVYCAVLLQMDAGEELPPPTCWAAARRDWQCRGHHAAVLDARSRRDITLCGVRLRVVGASQHLREPDIGENGL